MSVNTSEDYLDELLQAIEPIIGTQEPEETVAMPVQEVVEPEYTESVGEELQEVVSGEAEAVEINDLLVSLTQEAEEDIDAYESVMQESDVDDLINSFSNQSAPADAGISHDEDVKELLKQFTEDEDLSDIQDILDKNDSGEALDGSMLELPDVEVFKLEEESDETEKEEDKTKKSKTFGKVFSGVAGLFKKKGKKKNDSEEISTNDEVSVTNEIAESVLALDVTEEMLEADENDLVELLGHDIEDFVLDEDLSDIEQLLSGGTFESQEVLLEENKANDDTSNGNIRKDKNKKQKKESFFSKILNALTEEIEEPSQVKGSVPEANEVGVTTENLNILEELSKEDKKKAKQAQKEARANKKDKKNAKKKGQKGEGENDESADSKGAKGKGNKKPKKKREKKEKVRPVEVMTKPEKKLPRKRVLSTLALCLSILVAIIILQNIVFKTDTLKEASYAYDSGDYATCYANLHVIDRNEEEDALYQKSLIILSVQRKWDAYNNFVAMNNQMEALNSLLEGVNQYRNKEDMALEWGVHAQVTAVYMDILDALQGYGLSQAEVDEILSYESKVTYTKRLDSIINGTPFEIEEIPAGHGEEQPQPLQDILPGEEDFLPDDTTFMNEQTDSQVMPKEDYLTSDFSTTNETVVVGSNPVDISSQNDPAINDEPVIVGGQNVGSGDMNVASELTGDNVVVGVR